MNISLEELKSEFNDNVKFDYDLKNCNSDNYNYFIILLLLNIITVVGYHYLF